MIKCRFKTEKEFIDELGERWRSFGYGFVEEMDYLLGTELDNELITYYGDVELSSDGGILNKCNFYIPNQSPSFHTSLSSHWMIDTFMIKEIIKKPIYNERKKLVYD